MKKYKFCLLALSVVITMSNCNKNKLDLVNPNEQTAASFWQTSDEALQGANACYEAVINDGGYMRQTQAILDIRGEDVRSLSPWNNFSNLGVFNTSSLDPCDVWTYISFYGGVSCCNQVLEHVPNINMDQNLKNRVLGQAYFLRGFYYFHLVNFYGRVPIILKYGDIYEPQATVAQGWTQVISDLKNAASLLPTSYTGLSPDGQVGRATQGAAMGYLGKAYLFNNKFDSASIQFKKVIDLGIYSLVPNYIDNSTLANSNNAESIYEIQFSTVTGTNPSWTGDPNPSWGHVNGRASTYGPNNFAFSDIKPTPFLLNEFHLEKTTTGQVDPRCMLTIFYNDTADTHRPTTPMYQTTFQAAYAGNSALFNDVYCKKYQNYLGDRPDDFDFKSAINERVMRYADILLMYAECLNELNQTAAAAPYIQQVRNRAQLPDLTATFAVMSQQQMRDQLSHERLLEFSLEGHRFDDIHRWGWLQDPTKLALLKSRDPEFNTYIPGREYLPIPEQEISTNVNYTQNPGY